MSSPKLTWVDYPKAVEGPDTPYVQKAENDPALRGLPLVLGSRIISGLSFLAAFFYKNGGFSSIKDMPALDEVPYRFAPTVIPLRTDLDEEVLPFEESLLSPRHTASKFRYYSSADLCSFYRAGTLTPTQVVNALLPLIKQGQAPKGIYEDAWLDSFGNEHRVIAAAKASTERWAAGKPLSPLDGIPIGVKDDTSIEGYVNHYGLKHNPNDPSHKPETTTAWPVKKLQEAGAIVLGRNRMHEFGSDTTGLNPYQGTPTNHLNNAYYPGGSTSGGSSAVGSGIVPIALGTDAGGSARIPPNFCGVYGLKTTHDRIDNYQHFTCCVSCPIAATVQDLTIAYRLMAQPNPDGRKQKLFAPSRPPPAGQKRYMGVYRDWFDMADPQVKAICDKALDYFAKEKGYEVVDISIPFVGEARTAHGLVCMAEITERIRSLHRTPGTDPFAVINSANRLICAIGSVSTGPDYLKANSLRELIMRHLAFLFEKYPGLMIMTPVTPLTGWARTSGDETYGMSDTNTSFANMAYIWLANLTGTPAVTAPVGYAEPQQGEGKLSVSLMATGEWNSEEQLLGWASEAEDYLHDVYEDGRRRPKTWLDVITTVKGTN